MTQEEKKLLLLKDLSARLPYGVEVNYKEYAYDIRHWKIDSLHSPAYSESGILIDTDYEGWITFTEYKGCGMSTGSRPLHLGKVLPYLRPISSMTEEEKQMMDNLWKDNNKLVFADPNKVRRYRFYDISVVDFLNSHHFDYRGLIEKGLAIAVTEENNPYKD